MARLSISDVMWVDCMIAPPHATGDQTPELITTIEGAQAQPSFFHAQPNPLARILYPCNQVFLSLLTQSSGCSCDHYVHAPNERFVSEAEGERAWREFEHWASPFEGRAGPHSPCKKSF